MLLKSETTETLTGKNKSKARREAKKTGFTIDRSDDSNALANYDYNWSDLETLRKALAGPISGADGQVERLVNQHIALHKPEGDDLRIIQVALNGIKEDIRGFKNRLNSIHKNYAGRSGKILSLEDYNIYTNAGHQFTIAHDEFRDFLLLNISSLESVLAKTTPVKIKEMTH